MHRAEPPGGEREVNITEVIYRVNYGFSFCAPEAVDWRINSPRVGYRASSAGNLIDPAPTRHVQSRRREPSVKPNLVRRMIGFDHPRISASISVQSSNPTASSGNSTIDGLSPLTICDKRPWTPSKSRNISTTHGREVPLFYDFERSWLDLGKHQMCFA